MTGTFVGVRRALLSAATRTSRRTSTRSTPSSGAGRPRDVIGDKAGISPDVGDLGSTIPAIFVVMTFMMWNWWSVYLRVSSRAR